MKRPLHGQLLTLAYAGELPPLLTPGEVLSLWLPRAAGEDRTVVAKRRAIEVLMQEAIASKTLPSIKLPDREVTEQAPPGGWASSFRGYRDGDDDTDELYRRTAPRTRTVSGLLFLSDSDVRQFVAVAPAQLQPTEGAPLSFWLASAGRPKSCVDEVADLLAQGVSQRKAFAQVAPLYGKTASGVKSAYFRATANERERLARPAETSQKPGSTLVSKGRFH